MVIPCFNAAPWLGTALASVAAQHVPAREVIVIDDGSTDGSSSILRRSSFPVTLLRTPHLGGAAARNAGLQAATSEWVAFLDADDQWYPTHLERAEHILAESDDSALLNHFDHLTLDGKIKDRSCVWQLAEPATGLSAQDFLSGPFVQTTACVVRRKAALAIGGFDPSQKRRHDLDFWLRLIARGTWSFDPVPTSAYRVGVPESLSSDQPNAQYYRLRAYIKNRRLHRSAAMDRCILRSARRAMAVAFTDGTPNDILRAEELAFSWLAAQDRLVFSAARVFPSGFRTLNRIRRNLLTGKRRSNSDRMTISQSRSFPE